MPATLYEVQHDTHEKGYSLQQVMERFRDTQQLIDSTGLLSLDEVFDIPFSRNMMVRVEATAVPKVRASSFDSVESVELENQTSIERDSQDDIWEQPK